MGFDYVKQFLQECEKNGVKTIVFTWPDDWITYIENDSWMKERFMTIEYNGKIYKSMDIMMRNNKELEIKHDTAHFADTPKDHHPSMLCHRVMADNIIKRIKEIR